MNINYNTIFKNLITLLLIVFIAYLINTVLYFYLPKEKVQKIEKTSNTLTYKRYEVKSAFTNKEVKKVKTKKVVNKKKEYQFLSNITLLAIYDMGKQNGFVTVQEKGKSETHVLGIDENFKGYKLDKVFAKYAIFTKNSKEYRLSLTTDNKKLDYEVLQTNTQEEPIENNGIQVIDEDRIAVKRDHVNSYIQNVDKIWKDIAIQENMKDGKIDGFKIQRIKRNSDFEKLGLQKNDVIKSVNNIELKSYNDAFKLYKKFSNTKALNIKIMRNNQEVEINYEIE